MLYSFTFTNNQKNDELAQPKKVGADENCLGYQILFGVSMLANLGMSVDDILSRTRINDVKKEVEEKQKEIVSLKALVSELVKENTELRKQNNDLKEEVEYERGRVRALEEQMQGLIDENKKLKQENSDLREVNQHLVQENLELKEENNNIRKQIAVKDEEIKKLNLILQKQDSDISYLATANALYAKVIDLQKITIDEKLERIKEMQIEINKKNFDITALQAANKVLKETITIDEKLIEEQTQKLKENFIFQVY